MGCNIEIGIPPIRLNFAANKHTQKLWIKALMHCNQIDINGLATILDLPVHSLHKVHQGKLALIGDEAIRLAQFFLLAFSD